MNSVMNSIYTSIITPRLQSNMPVTVYGTVQAQVYTRARVNHRALACRGVRASRVLGKGLTREYQTYLFC